MKDDSPLFCGRVEKPMAKIHLLSQQLANMIAAGEVVERPASVAKELVENSIDAGSRRITVEIKSGGVSYLRVTDDGHGIPAEDVALAFRRHATSKLYAEEDLMCIRTLGFRGEALAAISSVSRLEILSKTKDSPIGHKLTADENGVEITEDGSPDGTVITVNDLFYNVPARRKFMRKDASEASAISGVVTRAALSHPEISFKMVSDGAVKFITHGLYPYSFSSSLKNFPKVVFPLFALPPITYSFIFFSFLTNKRPRLGGHFARYHPILVLIYNNGF